MSQFLLHAEILRYKRREKTVRDLDTLEGRLCLHSICRSLRLSFSKAWSSILVLRWSHEGAEVQRERSVSSFIIIINYCVLTIFQNISCWYMYILCICICICVCVCICICIRIMYYVLCIMYYVSCIMGWCTGTIEVHEITCPTLLGPLRY